MVAYLKPPKSMLGGNDWRITNLAESPTVSCFALKLCDEGLRLLGSEVVLTKVMTEEVEVELPLENKEPVEQFDPQIVSR